MKRLIQITSGDDFLPPCRLPQPPEEERLWRGSEGHLSWWDDEGGAQGRQVERRQEAWLAGYERILGVWRLQLLPCVRVSACIRDSHILAGTSDPSRFLMFIRVVLFHSSCVLFYFIFLDVGVQKGSASWPLAPGPVIPASHTASPWAEPSWEAIGAMEWSRRPSLPWPLWSVLFYSFAFCYFPPPGSESTFYSLSSGRANFFCSVH